MRGNQYGFSGNSSGSSMHIPKPNAKAQRAARRRQIKKRDREFQSDGHERSTFDQTTEYVLCACGHTVERSQIAKHHVVRRKHMETRWDDAIAARLCWKHHAEAHTIGDVAFAEKYKVRLLTFSPETYALLRTRGMVPIGSHGGSFDGSGDSDQIMQS